MTTAQRPGRESTWYGHSGKVAHRTRWRAWRECFRTWRAKGYVDQSLHPYECRWGRYWTLGETAPLHWHNGHGRPFPPLSTVIYRWKRYAWWPYCRARLRVRRAVRRMMR